MRHSFKEPDVDKPEEDVDDVYRKFADVIRFAGDMISGGDMTYFNQVMWAYNKLREDFKHGVGILQDPPRRFVQYANIVREQLEAMKISDEEFEAILYMVMKDLEENERIIIPVEAQIKLKRYIKTLPHRR